MQESRVFYYNNSIININNNSNSNNII